VQFAFYGNHITSYKQKIIMKVGRVPWAWLRGIGTT
jgi:hypothetical protein